MARAAHRHTDMAGFVESDRPRCCRRQIDVPTSNPWAAIINTNCHTSAMTDHNKRAARQGTMRGRKSREIQAPPVWVWMTTETITPAVDTRDFGPANLA